jgi:phosphoglycerate-specific signal transduction histidine kinase
MRSKDVSILSDKDKEIIENVLVEMLVLAIKASDHVSPMITNIALGLASSLDEGAVTRAKEYAQYRVNKDK